MAQRRIYGLLFAPFLLLAACWQITFSGQVETPVLDPAPGNYAGNPLVTITCATSGAQIYFTNDGSEPTRNSFPYVNPFNVNRGTAIKAKAFKPGWDDSATASAFYSGITPAPVIETESGNYNEYVTVEISFDPATLSGLELNHLIIRYTLDGTDPDATSPVLNFWSPRFSVVNSCSLKVQCFYRNWNPSAIASAVYALNVPAVTPAMVPVPGGTFFNGTANVSLSPFSIGKYEITQAEYQAVMGFAPSFFLGAGRPVECVSWFKALEYCNRRSIMEGLTPCYSYSGSGTDPDTWPTGYDTSNYNQWNLDCDWNANGYRLPTEMEWLFAARGGNLSQGYVYSGSDDIGEVGWYFDNSGNSTHLVGLKAPNELGLYDMTGNVEELVWDLWAASYPEADATDPHGPASGSERVIRGGNWGYSAYSCALIRRFNTSPGFLNQYKGFRVARSAD